MLIFYFIELIVSLFHAAFWAWLSNTLNDNKSNAIAYWSVPPWTMALVSCHDSVLQRASEKLKMNEELTIELHQSLKNCH